ncbi:histidine phosphatase family protein [Sulfurimonas sp.]|uniref:SixA phosphatase family protein n=1 Tax=Sulfurimonas sp. TaxID=2022749 RepID=UPI003564ACA0
MKRLYIIRHAKSSWSDMGIDDFDRGLNKRGRLDAPMMALRLKDRGVIPDVILSSSAKRAKKTAKIIADVIGFSKKVKFEDSLYDVLPSKLHSKIKKIKNKHNTAFVIGHNPELNMLASDYIGFNENIVTCGILEIEFECDKWGEIGSENAKFVSYDYPKKS